MPDLQPAVAISIEGAGRMKLQIVVPIKGWQPQFSRYFWMVHLLPDTQNGLSKDSTADAFQIKSLSLNRFVRRLGTLTDKQVNAIAAAIALCVGYVPQ
jgi:mRNA interferase MazF